MTDNALAIRQQPEQPGLAQYVGPKSWPELIQQAQTLFRSGLLPKTVRTPEAAIAIIQTGRELRLNPMEAFRNVHVIEGTPTVSPRCKLSLIQRSGLLEKYLVKEGDGWAEVTMKRRGLPDAVTVRYTLTEAQAAGLTGKHNWKAWPKNMLRWRAIGFVADQLFSDVTGGHFTPDELGAETDEEGVPVYVSPEVHQSTAPAVAPEHIARVQETWQAALAAGWSEQQIGQFFARYGVRKKSAITEEHLAALREAIAPQEAEIVDEPAHDPGTGEVDPYLQGVDTAGL